MGSRRIWEIDFLRAIAVILMVTFHVIFDLKEFAGIDINYQSGFWYWIGKISALMFLFVAGISSGFSKNNVKRGIKILLFAVTITFVTYIFFREQYIRFGILHLLGVSMILFPLLKRMNNVLLLISAAVIAFTAVLTKGTLADTSLLLPFGISYKGFVSLDYYPISPYLSVFIIGVLAYKMYYYKRESLFKFNYKNEYISAISKNSLGIYLIHQPILVGGIFLFNFLSNK
ncbi:heparan-alpha-glucosaminide N-acetyltransferase [Clostridium aminobutyricum]